MIVLNKPFVSELLKETINKNNFPVLKNKYLNENWNGSFKTAISKERAVIELNSQDYPQIYTNSENSINWISKYLNQTGLPGKINLFKDKVKFRQLIQDLYPNFYFKEIDFEEIKNLDVTTLPKPFVIKPSVGFFSLGVYIINSNEEWESIPDKIETEIEKVKHFYPQEVMNASKFIIEECIEGDEFAIDVYFNKTGEPVVVGIFQHLFSSDEDVSDRVYFTSKELIKQRLSSFTQFAKEVGQRASLKNFPMHIEVRVNDKGEINPIEINPMRFGGWCTTADLTALAFDLNPYEYYFKQEKPDWGKILQNKEGKQYSMIILDNSTGYAIENIEVFDYDKLLAQFENPMDLRKTDYHEYPVFGILFTETSINNLNEIEKILKSDLKEFVKIKQLTNQE